MELSALAASEHALCILLAGSFFTQTLNLEVATVRFEIWDTAGQEKYHSVCHLYYRGAHAALLVYDITNKVRQGMLILFLPSCSSTGRAEVSR